MSGASGQSSAGGGEAKEKDSSQFPAASVERIIRKAIPPNAKVSKQAIAEVQVCAGDFVSFITSEAGIHCLNEKRKTLSGDDIIFALSNMGFDNYSRVLGIYMARYRESLKEGKGMKKQRTDEADDTPAHNHASAISGAASSYASSSSGAFSSTSAPPPSAASATGASGLPSQPNLGPAPIYLAVASPPPASLPVRSATSIPAPVLPHSHLESKDGDGSFV